MQCQRASFPHASSSATTLSNVLIERAKLSCSQDRPLTHNASGSGFGLANRSSVNLHLIVNGAKASHHLAFCPIGMDWFPLLHIYVITTVKPRGQHTVLSPNYSFISACLFLRLGFLFHRNQQVQPLPKLPSQRSTSAGAPSFRHAFGIVLFAYCARFNVTSFNVFSVSLPSLFKLLTPHLCV